MNEGIDLYVFANWRHAAACGFRNDRHPDDQRAMAFWPMAEPFRLKGLRFSRIIFAEGVRQAVADLGLTNRAHWDEAVHEMEFALQVEPRFWLKL